MASSSGTSSGGTSLSMVQISGSDENLKALMDQRKRKRMISNRESARRSRIRKQKHLDDLMAQVAQLIQENHRIITSINITTEHYLNVEAENTVLRSQFDELTHRLHSLNEIINRNNHYHNANIAVFAAAASMINEPVLDNFLNPLNFQHIMASADIFQY